MHRTALYWFACSLIIVYSEVVYKPIVLTEIFIKSTYFIVIMYNSSEDLRTRIAREAVELLQNQAQITNRSEALKQAAQDYTGFMGVAIKKSGQSLVKRYGNKLKTLSIASNRVSKAIGFIEEKKWNPHRVVEKLMVEGETVSIGLRQYELLALFPKLYLDMVTRPSLRSDRSISEEEWVKRAGRAFGIIDEAILYGVGGSGAKFQRSAQKKLLDSERYKDIHSKAFAYASALDLTEQLICGISMSDESEEAMKEFKALFERHQIDYAVPFSIKKNGVRVDFALAPKSSYTLTPGRALLCYPEDYLVTMQGSFVADARNLFSDYGVELDLEGTIALNSILTNE